MIRALFKGAGRIALWLATMAFLSAVGLFVVGSFLLMWPILRMSPREKRIKATMDFASAGMTMLTAFSDAGIKKMIAELGEKDIDHAGEAVDEAVA